MVEHGLGCSAAHGIFLDQRSNLCLCMGKVDSLPLRPEGSLDTINDNVLNKTLVEELVISYSIFLHACTNLSTVNYSTSVLSV